MENLNYRFNYKIPSLSSEDKIKYFEKASMSDRKRFPYIIHQKGDEGCEPAPHSSGRSFSAVHDVAECEGCEHDDGMCRAFESVDAEEDEHQQKQPVHDTFAREIIPIPKKVRLRLTGYLRARDF